MSGIADRLRKNIRRLKPWADRLHVEAYRLYDWDIPEYPFFVDIYKDEFLISDKSSPGFERDQQHLQELLEALPQVQVELKLEGQIPIHLKKRMAQTRTEKYEKTGSEGLRKVVREGPCQFLVNLQDYLDSGLFLDHRPLRELIRKEAHGKRILNLFCYTGSISVAAAKAGAVVTSMDLSNTYLEWAKDNFKLNELDPAAHVFVREDCLQFLRSPARDEDPKFDLIILDPPIFSNSKKMLDILDTQRDHAELIDGCLRRLAPDGTLYFSTNKQGFKLDAHLKDALKIEDITIATIPKDFHRQKVHVCFRIKKRSAGGPLQESESR